MLYVALYCEAMDDDFIKPCPWCHSNEDLHTMDDHEAAAFARFGVWCQNCAVTGPRAASEDAAWKAWNDRIEESEI